MITSRFEKRQRNSFNLDIGSVSTSCPPPHVSLPCLSSPDAGSHRSHRRPRRCWPGPRLRPGSPRLPPRKRCKGLRRPGWGPCIPARRGPSRPPACTSGRPGKTGPPWGWTEECGETGGGESRETARLERGGGGVMREKKTEQREISKLGKLIRYSSVRQPISQRVSE